MSDEPWLQPRRARELLSMARAGRIAGLLAGTGVAWAGRSHYAALLAAGVRIFERDDVTLHAKTVVIDGAWSVVGSANFDYRSVRYNDEANALVLGRRFGAAMESMFERDVARSTEIRAGAWARRGIGRRAKEWLARSVEAWL